MPGVLAAFREGIWGDVVGGGEGLRCPCEMNFRGTLVLQAQEHGSLLVRAFEEPILPRFLIR